MAAPEPKPTIDTCNACGKLFPRLALRLCTTCAVVEEHRFQLVRDFVSENDGAAIGEIARATGVSMSDVRTFTDGGRLIEITNGMAGCSCGGVGQRCRFCRSRLSATFRDMEQSMQRDHAGREVPGSAEAGRTSYVRRIRRIGD